MGQGENSNNRSYHRLSSLKAGSEAELVLGTNTCGKEMDQHLGIGQWER